MCFRLHKNFNTTYFIIYLLCEFLSLRRLSKSIFNTSSYLDKKQHTLKFYVMLPAKLQCLHKNKKNKQNIIILDCK